MIDQLTSLPVTVNRHHWCLTRENFTKLVFVICKENDNDKDREHASQSWKLFYWQKSRQWQWPTSGNLKKNLVWWQRQSGETFDLRPWTGLVWMPSGTFCLRTLIQMEFAFFRLSRQKIIPSMPFRYVENAYVAFRLIMKRSTMMEILQYHPEKSSYTWTDQPGQQILHSKEVKLLYL